MLRPVSGSQLHDDGTQATRVSQRIPLGHPVRRQPERSGPHVGFGGGSEVTTGSPAGALSESAKDIRTG